MIPNSFVLFFLIVSDVEREKSGSLDSAPANVYDSVCLGDYFGDYPSDAPTPNSGTPSPATSVNLNLKSHSTNSNNSNNNDDNNHNDSKNSNECGSQVTSTTTKSSHSVIANGVSLNGKYLN